MRARAFTLTAIAFVLVVSQAATRTSATAGEGGVTAPNRLSDTGLYVAGSVDRVDPRNRPFSPQYPLWSDGAEKSRWIYLPPGTTIDATDEWQWEFPIGTRFWKEFRFDGHKVETRLLWRVTRSRWITVSYLWNAEQTDAFLAPAEGVMNVADLGANRSHSIPAATDCTACHGTRPTGPLGFNALQLSTDRDPNAIHGEPIAEDMVTLRSLVDGRLVSGDRTHWIVNPPRIRTSNPRTRAMLGYFAANCGSCHNRAGEVSALVPSVAAREVATGDADGLARLLVNHRSKWQVPGVGEDESVLINPAIPESSAILVRMRSRRPSSQMPPLGTVIRDQKAIDALRAWIQNDLIP